MNFDMDMQQILYLTISMVLFLIAGSFHEYAHALAAYIQGDSTAKDNGRLTINPAAHIDIFGSILFPVISALTGFRVFGWMKPVPVYPLNFKNPSKGHAITSIAGPFSNFIQLAFGFILAKLIQIIFPLFIKDNSTAAAYAYFYCLDFIYIYVSINLTLMIFNLFPIPPLDGGWILRHFLPDRLKGGYDRFYRFGIILLYALLYLGIIHIIINPFHKLLVYLFYSLLSNINIAIVSVPFLFGLSIIYLFLRKEIHAFIKRKKFQQNYYRGVKENIEIKEETKKDNSKIVDSFKTVIDKMNNKEKINDNDRAVVTKFEGDINKEAKLCDEIDFEIDDKHCNECDSFLNCILRKIKNAVAG